MDARDRTTSRHWAIGPVVSGGYIAGYSVFDLVNRDTGRAHRLHVPTGGLSFGVNASGGSPSYTLFETRKPVNFASFDGVGSRITSANLGVFYGYSLVYLTLWEGSAYVSNTLAYIKMSGGGFMLPGGSVAHGVTKVSYGIGSALGKVPRRLSIPDRFDRDRIMVPFRIIPRESPTIILPEHVLFEFDTYRINRKAHKALLHLADLLIAPNRKPDGRDNPLGRSKNRRVEIVISGALPPGFAN